MSHEPVIRLCDGESLADYAIRLTRERDEARAEREAMRQRWVEETARFVTEAGRQTQAITAERDHLKAILATIAGCGVATRTPNHAVVWIDHDTLAALHEALEGSDA